MCEQTGHYTIDHRLQLTRQWNTCVKHYLEWDSSITASERKLAMLLHPVSSRVATRLKQLAEVVIWFVFATEIFFTNIYFQFNFISGRAIRLR